jgi:hypothetical protein
MGRATLAATSKADAPDKRTIMRAAGPTAELIATMVSSSVTAISASHAANQALSPPLFLRAGVLLGLPLDLLHTFLHFFQLSL